MTRSKSTPDVTACTLSITHTHTHTHTHSSGPACCYSCQSSSASSTLSSIAGAFVASNLNSNIELRFASTDGALLAHPPTSECRETERDGRLQTWFTDVTRENPVEVVVVLDVFRRTISNDSLYNELINGVTTVLRSLNNGDRVRRMRRREREREFVNVYLT